MANAVPENNSRSYLCLFLSLIGASVVLPLLPETPDAVSIGFILAHTLIIICGAFVATRNRVSAITLIAGLGLTYLVIGSALTIAGSFQADADIQGSLLCLEYILILPFYLTLIIKTSQHFIQRTTATKTRVLAGLSLALILGITFALAHSLLWHVDASAYRFAESYTPAAFDRFNAFLTYSFITIPTLGFNDGDITAANFFAKAIALLELITIALYLILIISSLVLCSKHPPDQPPTD